MIDRMPSVLGAALNDAAAVKMRLEPLGSQIVGALVSHVPKIVYQRVRISRGLKIAPPRKGALHLRGLRWLPSSTQFTRVTCSGG